MVSEMVETTWRIYSVLRKQCRANSKALTGLGWVASKHWICTGKRGKKKRIIDALGGGAGRGWVDPFWGAIRKYQIWKYITQDELLNPIVIYVGGAAGKG